MPNPPSHDLTGQRFGRLVATEIVGKDARRLHLWRCTCDCGEVVTLASDRLTSGNTKSCGGIRRKAKLDDA